MGEAIRADAELERWLHWAAVRVGVCFEEIANALERHEAERNELLAALRRLRRWEDGDARRAQRRQLRRPGERRLQHEAHRLRTRLEGWRRDTLRNVRVLRRQIVALERLGQRFGDYADELQAAVERLRDQSAADGTMVAADSRPADGLALLGSARNLARDASVQVARSQLELGRLVDEAWRALTQRAPELQRGALDAILAARAEARDRAALRGSRRSSPAWWPAVQRTARRAGARGNRPGRSGFGSWILNLNGLLGRWWG